MNDDGIKHVLLADLPEQLQTYYRYITANHIFVVVTWGCTASVWLAKILNSHPEILCYHAKKDYNGQDLSEIDLIKNMYLESVGYKVVGNVHGFDIHKTFRLKKLLGNDFSVICLEREPFSRLKSQISLFNSLENTKLWGNLEYIDVILERKNVTLPRNDYHHKLFVHGVNMLNSIQHEFSLGKIFKMEDFTTDKKTMKELIDEITLKNVDVSDQFLNSVLKIKPTNKHQTTKLDFEKWQLDVIERVVDDKTWSLYSKLGYKV